MTTIDDQQSDRDYVGAIYGSLLAASVVAGTGPAPGVARPWELATLLVATGIVFWLSHVYAHVVGDPHPSDRTSWGHVRRVAIREWPIAGAVLPPAVAALAGTLVGLTDSTSAWLALGVAVAGQTGWAAAAAVAAGRERWVVVLSVTVNLALGLVIVMLKAVLSH